MVSELRYLFDSVPGLEGVVFDEETHTSSRAWVVALCDAIERAGLSDRKYACVTNYSALDNELLTRMKRAGYYKVITGLESLSAENTRTFLKTGQKSKPAKLEQVLETCHALDIEVYATLTLGSLGSTVESDYQTIRSIEALYEQGRIHEFQVSVNMPMPGTPFYDTCRQNGWLHRWQGGLFPEPITLAAYPNYAPRQIMNMFYYAFGLQQTVIDLNRQKGIHYSNDDGEGWCKPVFDLKHRRRGTGVASPA